MASPMSRTDRRGRSLQEEIDEAERIVDIQDRVQDITSPSGNPPTNQQQRQQQQTQGYTR